MSTQGNPLAQRTNNVPSGVESPVFWGSILGVLVSSVLAAASYVFGIQAPIPEPKHSGWIIGAFCGLVGIRYYTTSVVFLAYDHYLSESVRGLSWGTKLSLFSGQTVLILGASLNIGLLTTYGAVASASVVLFQVLCTSLYWIPLGRQLVHGPEGRFQVQMILGEVAVGLTAGTILLRNLGFYSDDQYLQGDSLLLGAVLFAFIVEVTSVYLPSIKAFLFRTRAYIRES